jgi:hypothetical protein
MAQEAAWGKQEKREVRSERVEGSPKFEGRSPKEIRNPKFQNCDIGIRI